MKREIMIIFTVMISRQITIRPQDIVALLKIVSFNKNKQPSWMRKDLAAALFLSNSEITNVFERLQFTGLIDVNSYAIQSQALYEFLLYGLKHTFPAIIGQETKGVITGINAIPGSGVKSPNYVWPDYQGKQRGYAVTPLYPEVITAAKGDGLLHQLLAACDVLRMGQVREVNFARTWLKKELLNKE